AVVAGVAVVAGAGAGSWPVAQPASPRIATAAISRHRIAASLATGGARRKPTR
ncbi:MAG: hypothetical protein K0S88_6706, partial [Actinomycetia bacterium]|nr:hypothetical protein [Actinomycetes bacterium]